MELCRLNPDRDELHVLYRIPYPQTRAFEGGEGRIQNKYLAHQRCLGRKEHLIRFSLGTGDYDSCGELIMSSGMMYVLQKGASASSLRPQTLSVTIDQLAGSIRYFSDNKKTSFRPKRRPSRNYRPIKAGRKKKKDWMPGNDNKFVDLDKLPDSLHAKDELDAEFGPLAADVLREIRREKKSPEVDPFEEDLRLADYMLSEMGSTEDRVGERRALAKETESEEERQAFMEKMEEILDEGRKLSYDFEDVDDVKPMKSKKLSALFEEDEDVDDPDEDPDVRLDHNQLAHGEWSEMLVTVDRNVKLWRGGRLQSYRALVIGGNLNGCGGYGIGKAVDPLKAVDMAGRHCKRNIFFVDRYQNDGLTRDLVGTQNSCIVNIRATDNGLRGNELIREILKRFGIVNGSAKAHGNRNPWNVVRATFKALMTHESIEDIALKRGKRILSIDRARRMQI